MERKIDYLAHERKKFPDNGSWNSMLQKLITGVRYVRSIPGNQIRENMPPLWSLEEQLQKVDADIAYPKKEYIKEIMEALDNEPELDESKTYLVCEVLTDDDDNLTFKSTGKSFFQNAIAEEWIADSSEFGKKYCVLNVLTHSEE
jgi:hypothetical protein